MELRYFIVDAFTDHPFGGNPAGVVLPVGDRKKMRARFSEEYFEK